jgi:preprotein translocase subunit YajC
VNGSIVFIVVLLALMWLLLIRPQRRRQTAQQQLWQNVKPGDEVVTAGGLYGEVVSLDGGDVHVKIAENTVVRIALRSVAAVVPPEEPAEESEPPESEPQEAQPEEPPRAPTEPSGG